jgi:hypothetical protein
LIFGTEITTNAIRKIEARVKHRVLLFIIGSLVVLFEELSVKSYFLLIHISELF